MDAIENRFPQYDEVGQDLVRRACEVASEVLKEETRGNGRPFIEHPLNVALIVSDEIGLPADCVAAVFLHEATRKHPEIDLRKGEFHRQGQGRTGSGRSSSAVFPRMCTRWSTG